MLVVPEGRMWARGWLSDRAKYDMNVRTLSL
jgi:hypothetical protein